MQQLLTGKKRLPGFSSEWEVKKLEEIGEFKNGINKGKEDFGFGYPFVEMREAPLNRHIAILSRQINLPHQDPGDRFIAATAAYHQLTFINLFFHL